MRSPSGGWYARRMAGEGTQTATRHATRRGILTGVLLAVGVSLAGCGRSSLVPSPPDDELVRGGFGTGFSWATDGGPAIDAGPVDRDDLRGQVARSQNAVRTEDDDLFSLAIVATFPTAAQAATEAASLRDRLALDQDWFAEPQRAPDREALLDPDRDAPMSGPAAEWLTEANLAPGSRGIGWGGRSAGSDDPADVVWTIGRTVFVSDLKAESLASASPPAIHPIAHRWAAAGADLLVEGDDAGEGTILADLSCRPADPASGAALRDTIGETLDLVQWSPLPPWVASPTTAQAAARADIATYERIAQAVSTDPAIVALMTRIARAGDAEREALIAALGERIAAGVRQQAAGRVSPETLELMGRQPRGVEDPTALDAWQREVGARIGTVELRRRGSAPTADAAGPVAMFGTARVRDGRLEVGSLAFGRATIGLPLALAWLDERRCGDLRFALADGDP